MIGSGVYPVVLPWLALLFPIPTPPGGQSSPNLSAGSSIVRQALGLDSRNNGGWLLGYIWGQRRNGVSWWWCSIVPDSAIFLPVGSLLILGLGTLFCAPWQTTLQLLHTVLSPS